MKNKVSDISKSFCSIFLVIFFAFLFIMFFSSQNINFSKIAKIDKNIEINKDAKTNKTNKTNNTNNNIAKSSDSDNSSDVAVKTEKLNLANHNNDTSDFVNEANSSSNEIISDKTLAEAEKRDLYKVHSVVDGDTIKIYINNNLESIRLIGLDTPETVDPRKAVQCFGVEASNKAKEMLSGQNVVLEKDETQGERDKYGRLLLYVYLEDGTLFNKWMIENGYGHEYTYNIPYKYQADFQAAEKYARENKLGLWADDACAVNNSINDTKIDNTNVGKQESLINKNVPITDGPQVKKSSTGICYEIGTAYYDQTKNFVSYDSVEECLKSGGRLPKR